MSTSPMTNMLMPLGGKPPPSCQTSGAMSFIRAPAYISLARPAGRGRFGKAPADELDHAREALVDLPESAHAKRRHDLVRLEDPHPADALDQRLERRYRQLPAHRGHQRDPATGREHACHLSERRERLVEEVKRGEATEAVEGPVAKWELDGISAHEREVVQLEP